MVMVDALVVPLFNNLQVTNAPTIETETMINSLAVISI